MLAHFSLDPKVLNVCWLQWLEWQSSLTGSHHFLLAQCHAWKQVQKCVICGAVGGTSQPNCMSMLCAAFCVSMLNSRFFCSLQITNKFAIRSKVIGVACHIDQTHPVPESFVMCCVWSGCSTKTQSHQMSFHHHLIAFSVFSVRMSKTWARINRSAFFVL